MKRFFCFLLIIVCIMCTGCSLEEIKTYNYDIQISWAYFETEEELIDLATHIFEGVVVDMDFYVYNNLRKEVQQTPVDPEETHYCYLYTVYEIAVLRTYKGNTHIVEKVRLRGGVPDQKKEEQKNVLEQAGLYDPEKGIPLVKGDYKHVKLGESYLFCVGGNDGEEKTALSPYHFAVPEEQFYPSMFTQEEILAHLPYVPHPLLIGGIAVAIAGAVATTVLLIRKKKKKTEPEEMELTPEET